MVNATVLISNHSLILGVAAHTPTIRRWEIIGGYWGYVMVQMINTFTVSALILVGNTTNKIIINTPAADKPRTHTNKTHWKTILNRFIWTNWGENHPPSLFGRYLADSCGSSGVCTASWSPLQQGPRRRESEANQEKQQGNTNWTLTTKPVVTTKTQTIKKHNSENNSSTAGTSTMPKTTPMFCRVEATTTTQPRHRQQT